MADEMSKWWSKDTVALVTGANTGIGLAIVKLLLQHGLTVILTSRNLQNGHKAVDLLKAQGLTNVVFHQLDVTDSDSIIQLSKWVKDQFGGLDILVNNAGIAGTSCGSEDPIASARLILQTNYYGAKNVTQALLPLFKSSAAGGRIVNVSSSLGQLSIFVDEEWKQRLSSVQTLTEDTIHEFLQHCLSKAEENLPKRTPGLGVHKPELMYPINVVFYSASKAALNAYTALLAQQLQKRKGSNTVLVNSMCPVLTSTNMASHVGHGPEEGADTAVWLILLPLPACPTGKFLKERQERSAEYIEEMFEELLDYQKTLPNTNDTYSASDSGV